VCTMVRRRGRVSSVVIPTLHGASSCGINIMLSIPDFYSVDPKSILTRVSCSMTLFSFCKEMLE
jgi:hypothetical protein